MTEIRGALYGCYGNLGQLKHPRSYENDPNEDTYSTDGCNVSTPISWSQIRLPMMTECYIQLSCCPRGPHGNLQTTHVKS